MPSIIAARLRAYNVGFGDCLLLCVDYDDGSRRSILIDFGSTKLPDGAPADHLDLIAADIAEQTRGHLEMVVASHRHTDHINGFGGVRSGRIIAALEPDLVVQPWTEDPALAQHAEGTHAGFVRALADMQDFVAGVQLDSLIRRSRVPEDIGDHLKFLRDTNSLDRGATAALVGLGDRRQYVMFGDRVDVSELIPGVEFEVLGPPTLEQAPQLANHIGVQSQWNAKQQLLGDREGPLFPRAVLPSVPVGVNWLIPKIDRVQAGELLALMQQIDATVNNTSVILSITIGGTALLFPGDAGIENWGYALFDAPEHDAVLRRLAHTKLYKVGHHGGAEATPKTLWRNFSHRKSSDRLVTVLSAKAVGSDVKVGAEAGIELPCRSLVDALTKGSELRCTTDAGGKLYIDVPVELCQSAKTC